MNFFWVDSILFFDPMNYKSMVQKGNSKENGKEQISKTKVAKLTNLVHTSVVLVNYN